VVFTQTRKKAVPSVLQHSFKQILPAKLYMLIPRGSATSIPRGARSLPTAGVGCLAFDTEAGVTVYKSAGSENFDTPQPQPVEMAVEGTMPEKGCNVEWTAGLLGSQVMARFSK
jgi:hypothetical protein